MAHDVHGGAPMRVTPWHRLRPWRSWLPLLLAVTALAALLPAGCVPTLSQRRLASWSAACTVWPGWTGRR